MSAQIPRPPNRRRSFAFFRLLEFTRRGGGRIFLSRTQNLGPASPAISLTTSSSHPDQHGRPARSVLSFPAIANPVLLSFFLVRPISHAAQGDADAARVRQRLQTGRGDRLAAEVARLSGRRGRTAHRESPSGQRRRSALASTLLACLELARDGKVEIRQMAAFEPVYIRDRMASEAPAAEVSP